MAKKIKENIPQWKANKALEGSVLPSKSFGMFEIVNYVSNKEVYIKFLETGCILCCGYHSVRNGSVCDYLSRKLYGVGYLGAQKIAKDDQPIYRRWVGMIQRCYYKPMPAYKECTVCEEWHNLQNFLAWCKLNGFSKDYHLDKDLLVKGNKVYSPETCCFMPNELNQFTVQAKNRRGVYKIGVAFDKNNRRYKAVCRHDGKSISIGSYLTEMEAFMAYKLYKEAKAKTYAKQYEDILAEKVIQALLKFTVEEDD